MKLEHDHLIYSPSDLSSHISCKHLTQLNKQLALGEIAKPEVYTNRVVDLLIERGQFFEQEHLEFLKADGNSVVEISQEEGGAEEKTIQAMKNGVLAAFLKGLQETLSNK